MATKTFNTRIANKRDTSANWTSNNPVLLNGEIIIVDTEAGQVRYKVGNGTSTYTQLPFTDESLITNINGKLSLSGGTMTGNIDMGGHKLTGLGAPVNPNDAVRQADLKVVSDEVDGIIAGTTGITLAPATTTKIGGVIVGDGIEVEVDGTISTNPVPDGGTEGQMLYKSADGAAWGDKPVMVVRASRTGNQDKTISEIFQAYQNNYAIYCVLDDELVLYPAVIKKNYAMFACIHNLGSSPTDIGDLKFYVVYIDDSGIAVSDSSELSSLFLENPSGGTTGQVLTKTSTGEEWSDAPSGLPEGGTEGQILAKTSSGAAWVDKPESGLTQSEADERYLQLTGGTANQDFSFSYGTQDEYGAKIALTQKDGIVTSKLATNNDLHQVLVNKDGVKIRSGVSDISEIYVSSPDIIDLTGTTHFRDLEHNEFLYIVDEHSAYGYPAITFTKNPGVIANLESPPDDNCAANKAYVDSKAPTSVTVTLTTSGWSSNTQTVTVSGVSATETAQLITPTPAIASQSAYYEAGIMCTNQGTNSLTFTCQTVPTSNLTVYVVIQPLN